MDWLLYSGILLAVLVLAALAIRALRKKKNENTDDIYPMW